ncbi:hybrid sensor histidine kinase/response regulator transcription factor [Mucilaginibacter sp. SP1R1]|uniref:hybrid sensor histidine kinase/response regulator transcription factor n=1 Tax=Mucilaginibacter sp. SP1R1 TaxID=2723091 RepID=UPI00161DB7A8|nr:hybrid sensor histidine kinase/response regulator transcription factor [Mucilaginibacter sp. SP1R1]MBB6148935.1 signal transduction histidine kinase/ligand-binding sensor domain-containing protein/CheY-like chemotaxis protein [Mucilaginibacter sp. SP1R1]
MKNCKRFFAEICVFICTISCLRAQNIPVKYLGLDEGLSNNAVTCIFKDHYGFMWMGTYDGLNRYDGNSFKVFKNRWNDPQSLINNHIISITGDHQNKIWIGTEKGLAYYDYSNSQIHPAYYRPANQTGLKKITSRINILKTDINGNVYIATEGEGILICKKHSTICEQVKLTDRQIRANLQTLTIDNLNRVWLMIRDIGLFVYKPETQSITLMTDKMKGLNCITADPGNKLLWLGLESGLFSYNIAQHTIKKLDNYKLSSNNIMQLYMDKHAQLWVATDGGGINIINTLTNKVTYMLPNDSKGMLSSGAIYALYEDPGARMWVATLRGGVNVIDYKSHQFKTIANDPLNAHSLVNNFTRSFCEDENNNIWIGTSGGGLSYWNTKLNTFQNYKHHENNPQSLSSDFVFSIVKDFRQNIWIATLNGGINLFNKDNHTFKHYTCYNDSAHIEDRNIWKLYEDAQHNLWATATRGGSVFIYNRIKDKFELFDYRLKNINAINEDRAGQLWLANNDQLIKVDLKNKHHQYISINSPIHAIYDDSRNQLWLGTDGGGLLLFNRKTNTFTRYTEADGLPSNSILNMLEDKSGAIWVSTFNGISKYDLSTRKFKNYYASDGLQSNQFNYNAALKLSSGEFLFGGIKGFNRFFPDSVKNNSVTPPIYVTGFKINNISIQEDSSFKGSRNVIDMKKITLSYDQAVIAVDYVALEYSFPDKISYAYYLEGWDHNWNYVGKVKTAYYSRLNEGHYTLRIKSTGTDGVWSNNQKVIYITVLPPWYRTWWAWLLYIGFTIAVVYRYWLYQTRQTKLKHEVEITVIKAEKERELNEKKLSFFTNISHEFRTPLTLIINPIKDLLHDADERTKDELKIIYRNARRLLGLVDHLLLFRKAESETDKLNVVKLNFVSLAEDVFQCFIQQAKAKKIKYCFQSLSNDIEVYVDREKIEIALFNLISNAVKFTPSSGTIEVIIKENEENVFLEVVDNGCGIKAGTDDKLFDKFYQIKDNKSLKNGFGIGLYLAKSFLESHGGNIDYKNNTGGGTIFTVTLSKTQGQFASVQVFEDTPDQQRHIYELIGGDIEEEPVNVTEEKETGNLELLISDQQSVLIIDDNSQIRDYIKKIFKPDYKIYEAPDGLTGLDLIKKHLPDIIICDVMMDGLTGIELCKLVKQDTSLSHIPIILLTGDATLDIKLKGIEVGAVDFVSKPFEKDLLVARVKGILKSKSELQNYFYNEITLKTNSRNISEQHKDFLYSCIAIIEDYLSESDFDVKTIATEMGMSYSALFKRIKLITGQSVNGFVRFVRLRKAAELLINTNCNVNEAALQSGFNDIKYFREQFHALFGINPSEFIKKHRYTFHKSYKLNYNSGL